MKINWIYVLVLFTGMALAIIGSVFNYIFLQMIGGFSIGFSIPNITRSE